MTDLESIPGLQALRSLTLGDPGVRIVFLDGRVDVEHDCFAGASFEAISADWETADGVAVDWAAKHATMVASMVVGQPDSSVEGIAPRIHAIFVEAIRNEVDAAFELTLARVIEMALGEAPDIIHIAHCLPSQSGRITDLLRRALAQAEAAEVLVVAPSGNDAGGNLCSPADQSNVLAVGGLDDDGSVRDYSNHGPRYADHGVMAWAENLKVALPGGGTDRVNGTSGAAPQVSAVAALLLSAARGAGLRPSALQVGRIIRETARPLTDDEDRRRAIGGILDPVAAFRALLGDSAPGGVGASASAAELPSRIGRPSDDLAASGSFADGVSPSLRLPSRLFALGDIGIDHPDEAKRDRLAERMVGGVPEDLRAVTSHLVKAPEDATLLTWTLGLDDRPMYALRPTGPDASAVHRRLVEVLAAGTGAADGDNSIERACIPGVVTTETMTLRHDAAVPVVNVSLPSGINAWRTLDLAHAAAATVQGAHPDPALVAAVAGYLRHIYEQHRNAGVLGRDRALNFSATNAAQAARALATALSLGLELHRVEVVKGRFDRPYSVTWDIHAWTYDPDVVERSQHVFTWTVDVADQRPVGVGAARTWAVDPASARESHGSL